MSLRPRTAPVPSGFDVTSLGQEGELVIPPEVWKGRKALAVKAKAKGKRSRRERPRYTMLTHWQDGSVTRASFQLAPKELEKMAKAILLERSKRISIDHPTVVGKKTPCPVECHPTQVVIPELDWTLTRTEVLQDLPDLPRDKAIPSWKMGPVMKKTSGGTGRWQKVKNTRVTFSHG